MPKDFSIRPSSVLPWCAPSPRSVWSSLLICSTGHLRWYALTTCRGIHSSRLVTRIFVCFGPRLRPRLLRITVTSPMCRRHRRVLYTQKVLQPLVHHRAYHETRRRLHRGPDGAAGQSHGPRRGRDLGIGGHRRGEGRGAAGRRCAGRYAPRRGAEARCGGVVTMRGFLLRWLFNTVAIYVTTRIVSGLRVPDFGGAIIAALVLGIVNAFIRPII